jgi:hypothetical protein
MARAIVRFGLRWLALFDANGVPMVRRDQKLSGQTDQGEERSLVSFAYLRIA